MAAKILVDFQQPSGTKAVRGCVRKIFIFLDKKCSYSNTHDENDYEDDENDVDDDGNDDHDHGSDDDDESD